MRGDGPQPPGGAGEGGGAAAQGGESPLAMHGRLDGQGNFSEVEDRRKKVEAQLKVLEEKFGLLKENYYVKMAQQEKLLATEKATNRQLGDQLDALEGAGGRGLAPGQVWTVIISNHTSPTSRWCWCRRARRVGSTRSASSTGT